jgi:hypothetical protein
MVKFIADPLRIVHQPFLVPKYQLQHILALLLIVQVPPLMSMIFMEHLAPLEGYFEVEHKEMSTTWLMLLSRMPMMFILRSMAKCCCILAEIWVYPQL